MIHNYEIIIDCTYKLFYSFILTVQDAANKHFSLITQCQFELYFRLSITISSIRENREYRENNLANLSGFYLMNTNSYVSVTIIAFWMTPKTVDSTTTSS